MTTLPQEIIIEIFSLLSVKPLVRFQCISKPWLSLINGPYFIKLHHDRSVETNRERAIILEGILGADYHSVNFSKEDRLGKAVKINQPLKHPEILTTIVGSCNGLVCISDCDGDIAIWNPFTRKYRKLPLSVENSFHNYFAFGYDRVNDDYKVLRITKLHGVYRVEVYSTLRGNSWRMVEEEWPIMESSNGLFGPAFSNGALHWMVINIVAFDLSTEKFRVHPLPDQFCGQVCVNLIELRGRLCSCTHNEVWEMKEYGNVSSWTLLYSVRQSATFCQALAFSHNGQEVLTSEASQNLFILFWYDIKKKTSRIVNIRNAPDFFRPFICVGSLLLP